ncbi:MAG: queuosine precursor transporter [Eubacterium sp.]|nr:queuosine precursor transporter [Eubacterium sp.]
MIFATSLVISNVVTGKVVDVPITLFGAHIQLPGAAICYAITYLMTDVIGEIWGRKEANRCVFWGFICQVLASLMILLTQYLPAVDPDMQKSYDALLGQNWVIVLGSLTAYIASQSWDVLIFHKVRDRMLAKDPENYHKRWIWNNLSTLTSQIIDTILFIGIAFGCGFGWLFDSKMWPTLGAMFVGQYILKAILAIIDTPVFCLLTRKRKNGEENN